MSSRKWDPLQEMEAALRGLGRPAAHAPGGGHERVTSAEWAPAVDIAETDDEYLINIEVAEVGKEDVNVSVSEGVLSISGERKLEQPEGLSYHRVERGHGTFARTFALPEDVQIDRIRAEHREGMLYLHLPKQKEPPSKSIKIEVS